MAFPTRTGSHCGGCCSGGRSGRGGHGGRGRGTGRDREPGRGHGNSNARTDYYSKDDWEKLSYSQRDAIYAERDRKNEAGGSSKAGPVQ